MLKETELLEQIERIQKEKDDATRTFFLKKGRSLTPDEHRIIKFLAISHCTTVSNDYSEFTYIPDKEMINKQAWIDFVNASRTENGALRQNWKEAEEAQIIINSSTPDFDFLLAYEKAKQNKEDTPELTLVHAEKNL